MSLAREQLGAIKPEGFNSDEDLALFRGGDGDLFKAQGGGGAGGVEEGGFHCFLGGAGVGCHLAGLGSMKMGKLDFGLGLDVEVGFDLGGFEK